MALGYSNRGEPASPTTLTKDQTMTSTNTETRTYVLHLTDAQLEALQATVAGAASASHFAEMEHVANELRYARPRSNEDLIDMGQDSLRREYFGDVRAIAEEIVSEVTAEAGEDADEDEIRETVYERVWESVDGSQWVIYTHRAMDALRISENDGYSIENFGTDGLVTDGGIEWSKLAFGAMYADVQEEVSELLEAWMEARETEEEVKS